MTYQTKYVKHAKQAFTLIELLVVISIILVLASLLLPSVKSLKDKANSTKCKGNLKNLGSAMASFASDNRGYYPPGVAGAVTWDDLLSGYDGRAALDPASSSVANGMLANGLDLVQHGAQPMYHCPSYKNPFTAMSGTVRLIPRSYSINRYDRLHQHGGNTLRNYALGVGGYDNSKGAERTVHPGHATKEETFSANSRTVGQVGNPSRSLVLVEESQVGPYGYNSLGRNGLAFQLGAFFRNTHCSGATFNTIAGAHKGGLLDNYLLADGTVKEMDFQEVSTRDNGAFVWAGGDWRGTMWDASPGRLNVAY